MKEITPPPCRRCVVSRGSFVVVLPYAQLIDATLLTAEEREWLADYHATVLATLGPLLKDSDREAYAYLVRETRPLG